jgi:hypothetical protein
VTARRRVRHPMPSPRQPPRPRASAVGTREDRRVTFAGMPDAPAGAIDRRRSPESDEPGSPRRSPGDLAHNACNRYTSAATASIATSTTAVVTAANTMMPTRRVHRASRVRATSTPAARRASSGARRCETSASPTPVLPANDHPRGLTPRPPSGSTVTAGFVDAKSRATRLHHSAPGAQAAAPEVARLSGPPPPSSTCPEQARRADTYGRGLSRKRRRR